MNIKYLTTDECSPIVVGDLGTMPYVPAPSMARLESKGNVMRLTAEEWEAIVKVADGESLTTDEQSTLIQLERKVRNDKYFR